MHGVYFSSGILRQEQHALINQLLVGFSRMRNGRTNGLNRPNWRIQSTVIFFGNGNQEAVQDLILH